MPAALRYYFIIACLTQSVKCEGSAQLTFSSNPVYSGKDVTLTFSYSAVLHLWTLTIDAFNGTLKQGSLFYEANAHNFTAVGVFANRSLNGWPNIPPAATSVSLTLTATPSHELDYNFTAVAFDSSLLPRGRVVMLKSARARLLVYSVQLTFSSNPVYSGKEVTLTFSYPSGLQLSELTADAFNGTLKQGSLFYQANPKMSTAAGVFANRSLNGWPNIPPLASSVSVTLTATPSHELDYNCTVVFFDGSVPPFGAVQILSSAPARLLVYSSVRLTFSSNPVYSGKEVTLTFSYPSGLQLVKFTVDAFNGTLNQGSLLYLANPTISTAAGVFANRSLNEGPTVPNGATSVSVTLTASPSHELDYNCTVVFFDSSVPPFGAVQILNSVPARLLVYTCPSTPIFKPSPIVFTDWDDGLIVCESRNGKPAAFVSLTVGNKGGGILAIGSGSDSASVVLPSPLSNWHNATATCRVTNHNCYISNPTTGDVHISFNTSVPEEVCTDESNAVLNCSRHVRSYQGFYYKWAIPAEANVTGRLDLESLNVPKGQFGSFNCTATNNYSMASDIIVFTVSSVCHHITTPISNPGSPSCGQCWIIGLVLGIIAVVVTTVFIVIMCKRGHFFKGITSTSASQKHCKDLCVTEESSTATQHSVDREYDSLDTQRCSEPTYAQLILENSSNITLYENFKSS